MGGCQPNCFSGYGIVMDKQLTPMKKPMRAVQIAAAYKLRLNQTTNSKQREMAR